ncbi:MAG: tyrosine--tRNA ligase [Candidatus Omnitrophota bacterium]|nr:tyrosine--tRNA ligase [Candidatus Omnitrophota bacterium]
MDANEQLKIISRGVAEIINLDQLKSRIEQSLKSKTPLRIKAGFDPTAPDIHLGHVVLLKKLRQFQDCGHKVLFLIGDATALVGDPSGQSLTRKVMTWEEVKENARTYEQQVSKILKTDKNVFERIHNSDWFLKHTFTFEQFVELAKKYTIARILERDDFQKRLKENKPITFLETFYPLMQGYDSVKLKADIELGGTDQKFNLLLGRELQREYGQEPQIVITTPLLEGLDGVCKMSKSFKNHIGINEPPKEMFGKIMSISDDMMWKYYELLTEEDLIKIKKLHPKEAKLNLAQILVEQFSSSAEAKKARYAFERIFSDKQNPEDILEYRFSDTSGSFIEILHKTGITSSKNEARRLIEAGAVYFNNKKINENWQIKEGIIRVGKRRFLKLIRSK